MEYITYNRSGIDGKIGVLKLHRPDSRNAFNTQMAKELIKVFQSISNSDVRTVMLGSSSTKAFCSGADLKERNGMTEKEWKAQHQLFEEMFFTLADLPQPVIAVVDGYALAGGFEMVLNCDFIVAAHTAVFGLPEVTRGIMPGCGGSRLLAKRVGVHRAKEWICSGRLIQAGEAEHVGLLNRITTTEDLWYQAFELAERIASNAPLAVQNCKKSVDLLFGMDDRVARKEELVFYNQCVDTEDRLEGVKAFVEKRPPSFKGR